MQNLQNGLQCREKQNHSWGGGGGGGGGVRMNYASVQRGEDLQAKTGDHVHAHRRRVYTSKNVIAVNENYHRVAFKEKTIAKMFVLWPSEEGYQEEIVWKIDVDKHKATVSEVSSWIRTALSKMSHGLEM